MIQKIHCSNFRSFDEFEIGFGKFNVLIGANAAGKSNFIQLLKFIKDIKSFGYENAIQLQGGLDFLSNFDFPEKALKIDFQPGENSIIIESKDDTITKNEINFSNGFNDLKIKIFDFNFDLIKSPSSIESLLELEENGSNLPVVLKNIFKEEDNKRSFLNYLQFILPFVKDINSKDYFDNHLMISLNEVFNTEKIIPGSMLSNGTISIICIIASLFFDKSDIAVFEEPDRSVHPQTHEKLVKLFYEASEEKQIFLSTHNPEILKYCNLEDIYLLSRNNKGYTEIKNVTDYKTLKLFLDQDMGIDQIFCDLLLTD